MQTHKERLLSTSGVRHWERGPEIPQHACRVTRRSSQHLVPAISLQIQVPEQKQRLDQVIQQTRVAGRARGIKQLSLSESADQFSSRDLPVLFCDYGVELRGNVWRRGSSAGEKLTGIHND